MNKRQLRQSAAADFMESLEHLDDLLGGTTDKGVLEEDNLPSTDTDQSQPSPLPQSVTKQTSHQPKATQPQRPNVNS